MIARTDTKACGGVTDIGSHWFVGLQSVQRGDAFDPDYGTKNCTEFPASTVQRAYEVGRLAAFESRLFEQRCAARAHAWRAEPGSLLGKKGTRAFPSRNGSCVGKARVQLETASARR